MNAEIDIRDLLPTISVPTLVLYRADEYFRERSRFMGEHIPGARMVELPGNDHLPWEGDRDSLLDEIERFLAGARRRRRARPGARHPALCRHRRADHERGQPRRPRLGRAARTVHRRRPRPGRALSRSRGRQRRRGAVRDLRRPGPRRPLRVCDRRFRSRPRRARCEPASTPARSNGRTRPCAGIAVDIGACIAAVARPGEVLVSSTVKDIVAGSGIGFEERGEQELGGVPGRWRLFAAAP